jgi:integrase/recombinase XerD
MNGTNFAGHLQRFFTGQLLGQMGASPHTVASYRDTFRLLLKFASKHHRCQASDLKVDDLDAKLVSSFLKHLEQERRNSTRSRNNRLERHSRFLWARLSSRWTGETLSAGVGDALQAV